MLFPAQAGVIPPPAMSRSALSLFPAQAGVIPNTDGSESGLAAVPRASGGDRHTVPDGGVLLRCSPRKRG